MYYKSWRKSNTWDIQTKTLLKNTESEFHSKPRIHQMRPSNNLYAKFCEKLIPYETPSELNDDYI